MRNFANTITNAEKLFNFAQVDRTSQTKGLLIRNKEMSSLCRLQDKVIFHHASLDCHKKTPFPIIFRIKVLLDPGSFKRLGRIHVDHSQTTLQIILYCKLSFNLVTFTFAIKHLISLAISFSKGCNGGGEGAEMHTYG